MVSPLGVGWSCVGGQDGSAVCVNAQLLCQPALVPRPACFHILPTCMAGLYAHGSSEGGLCRTNSCLRHTHGRVERQCVQLIGNGPASTGRQRKQGPTLPTSVPPVTYMPCINPVPPLPPNAPPPFTPGNPCSSSHSSRQSTGPTAHPPPQTLTPQPAPPPAQVVVAMTPHLPLHLGAMTPPPHQVRLLSCCA